MKEVVEKPITIPTTDEQRVIIQRNLTVNKTKQPKKKKQNQPRKGNHSEHLLQTIEKLKQRCRVLHERCQTISKHGIPSISRIKVSNHAVERFNERIAIMDTETTRTVIRQLVLSEYRKNMGGNGAYYCGNGIKAIIYNDQVVTILRKGGRLKATLSERFELLKNYMHMCIDLEFDNPMTFDEYISTNWIPECLLPHYDYLSLTPHKNK